MSNPNLKPVDGSAVATAVGDYPPITPDFIDAYLVLCAKAGLTPYFHGGSGVGKSESILEAGQFGPLKELLWKMWAEGTGKELPNPLPDIPVNQWLLPNLDPEVLLGLPYYHVVDEATGDRTTRQAIPEALRLQTPSIMLFDEVSAADTRMQKAVYQIVNEKRIFNIPLPPGTLVILAGNRAQDRGGVRPILFPLANRCAHRTYVPTADAWVKWAVRKGVPEPFVTFVQSKGLDAIWAYDQADPSLAQLTPRSYWKASCAYKTFKECSSLGIECPPSELDAGIASEVGYGAAVEILAWIQSYEDLPTWEEIRKAPTKARLPKGGRPDLAYLVAAMTLERFRDKTMESTDFKSLATYLERFVLDQPQATDAVGYALAAYMREGVPSKEALAALQQSKVLAGKVFALMSTTLAASRGAKMRKAS